MSLFGTLAKAFSNVTKDNGKIIEKFADGGYKKIYKDGLIERVRFTKTREVHDFFGPHGKKMSIWQKK